MPLLESGVPMKKGETREFPGRFADDGGVAKGGNLVVEVDGLMVYHDPSGDMENIMKDIEAYGKEVDAARAVDPDNNLFDFPVSGMVR